MRNVIGKKIVLLTGTLLAFMVSAFSFAETNVSPASVSPQVSNKAKENKNWKNAFLTGKHAQIVFMSVSPTTNPKNEIGMETHKFDQVIFVVAGNGTAILDGKETKVKSGDMIFIPLGVAHNVVNSNKEKPLKIISVYSDTDIPAQSVYKTKADEPKD